MKRKIYTGVGLLNHKEEVSRPFLPNIGGMFDVAHEAGLAEV